MPDYPLMPGKPSRKDLCCFVAQEENRAGERCWIAEAMGRAPTGFGELLDALHALLNDPKLDASEIFCDVDVERSFGENVVEAFCISAVRLRRIESTDSLLSIQFLRAPDRLVVSGNSEALRMFRDQIDEIAGTAWSDKVRFMAESWGGTSPAGGPNLREDVLDAGAIALPFFLVRAHTEFTTESE